ncbi:uncharacterized protein JCM6883_005543 [Sporobolomyces salmoneus]|uniref:uncharacterized protein n=1 Tax=Sporobolomyces salmoneus TaxID=183962 RepID=UPI003180BF38
MSGLHRRTSSAALHYSRIPGNEGQDISLYSSSAANVKERGGGGAYSSVPVNVRPEDELLPEEEEKDGLLSQSPRLNSRQASNKGGRQRSKCRILLLLVVLTSTAIILYALVTGWIEKRDAEKVWGNWKDWAQYGKTAPTVGKLNSSDSSGSEDLFAAPGRLRASSSSISATVLPSRASFLASKAANASSASNVTRGSFSRARMTQVNERVDQGNLSAYRWHETLPELTKLPPYSSSHEGQPRRLIVVGDLHGTYRSLLRLLRGINYTPSHDTLLHTGDILSKSTLENSLHTIRILRKLGAKGVRGNHDQKVLEWRSWMETLGPLDQTSGEVGAKAHTGEEEANVRKGELDSSTRVRPSREDSSSWSGAQDPRNMATKTTTPEPRREKRDWFNWPFRNEDGNGETDVLGESSDSDRYEEAQDSLSSAKTQPTDRRRPSGQRPARLSSPSTKSSSSSLGTASRLSRPTSSSTGSSSSSNLVNTTLLGPLYAHLDPSLTTQERSLLGIQVPSGWEWGSQHFVIARHLSLEDVAYLESLPLTLWVEELNSFIVHAGIVPWNQTPQESFSPFPSSLSTSPLSSTSEASFVPDSKTDRSLAASLRGSLLLLRQNRDPFTLLNLRTLSLVRPASSGESHRNGKVRIKGPPAEWKVSSKSHRASRNQRPWWSAWEYGVSEYEKVTANDKTIGIVYGHWASQGLQAQKHSVGLDSGCVYGRKLSALVLDMSSPSVNESPNPLSSLASTSNVSSSNADPSSYSRSSSPELTTSPSNPSIKARPPLPQGGRLDRVVKASSTSTLSAPTLSSAAAEEASRTGDSPWWRPWKRDNSQDEQRLKGSEGPGVGEDALKLGKRAPPQFRPLGGLEEEKFRLVAAMEEDSSTSSAPVTTMRKSSADSDSTPTSTTVEKHKKHPRKSSTSSLTPPATSSPSITSSLSSDAASRTSLSSRLFPSLLRTSTAVSDIEDDEDTRLRSPGANSEVEMEAEGEEEEEEEQDPESPFSAQQVIYQPLGRDKKVWIVDVDCGSEIEMDTE